jgi:putative hydrolase of the HAD superfamily
MLRAIVFDGDDTLWETERLYDEARARARRVVERAGLDGEAWEATERVLDVENVAHLGHTEQRFPTSCAQAYEQACAAAGDPTEKDVLEAIKAAAQTVFGRKAPVVAGAEETLAALREMGLLLVLLTKGEPRLQGRRVDDSGLRDFFDLVEIVEEKSPETILEVLHRLGVEPHEALTIGNSVRSDVLPSLAAGVTPVWIDAHVWEYERQYDDFPSHEVSEAEDLRDVIQIARNGMAKS